MNAALVLTALFNGAWQGALLCICALILLRIFRRLNATTIFVVWNVLLCVALLLPAANYVFAPKPYTVVIHRAVWAPTRSIEMLHRPARSAMPDVVLPQRSLPQHVSPPPAPEPSLMDRAVALAHTIMSNAFLALIALGSIALFRLAVLLRDLIRVFAVRRSVRVIDAPVALADTISRRYLYAASREMRSPCVIGFAPALIVIPEDLLHEPAPVLKSIVLHEREHVRRFDDIQNLVQRLVGAIAFFLPGVIIALRELALYREKICDDAALNGIGDPVSYALTLTDMAQWAGGRGIPMPTFVFKRRHLMQRLEVLLDSAVSHSPRTNRRFALSAVVALGIAAAIVLRFQVPVIAQTIVTPAAPPAHAAPQAPVVAPRAAVKPKLHPVKVSAPRAPRVHLAPGVQVARRVLIAPRVHVAPRVRVAPRVAFARRVQIAPRVAYSYTTTMETPQVAPVAPPLHLHVHSRIREALDSSGNLLDELRAQNMTNLSVDQLIALRDHGVTPLLIRSAAAYFGRVDANQLVYLADHGVGPQYIETLRASGVRGIAPADAVHLMDHGVTSPLIAAAFAYYNPHPSAGDLTYLADHGVSAQYLQALRSAGLMVGVGDTVLLLDRGVDAAFVRRVRAFNPRASVDDIIRLRDSGF